MEPLDYARLDRGADCNYWEWDPTIRREVRRAYPDAEFDWAEGQLRAYGETVGHEIAPNAARVDRVGPELHTHDRRGDRIDRVEYPPGQAANERLTYGDHRLTHDAFHAPPGREEPVGLVHPLSMQTLLCFADAGFACPVSMTTGAALVLDRVDDGSLDAYLDRLTTDDPAAHVEGAMFLTERQGGSDVGANAVTAEPVTDVGSADDAADAADAPGRATDPLSGADRAVYELSGEKWFCSNVDAQGALVTARTPDAPEGTDGLSLFLVPHRLPTADEGATDSVDGEHDDSAGEDHAGGPDKAAAGEHGDSAGGTADAIPGDGRGLPESADPVLHSDVATPTGGDGTLNAKRVRRLKDKLGTLAVPTGEVEFDGAIGYLVGDRQEGFRAMTEMINYERLTNATGAVGLMGRALLESKVWAANREAFGDRIDQYPLLRRDLSEWTVTYEAAAAFAFEATRWYDRRTRAVRDTGPDGPTPSDTDHARRAMRLLTPVAKLVTADLAVEFASEACEVVGGNGYVRGYTTARLLRDAQVLPIWEGTSNVLSLETLRVFDRLDAHEVLFPLVREKLDRARETDRLPEVTDAVEDRFVELQNALGTLATASDAYAQYHAKRLADLVFEVVAAAVLLAEAVEAAENGRGRPALVVTQFVRQRFDDRAANGITSGSTVGDDYFDALARYGSVSVDEARDVGLE
ncbi:MAG: acyl-CoA dehydrogenase family protein [Halobaculum sp.]